MRARIARLFAPIWGSRLITRSRNAILDRFWAGCDAGVFRAAARREVSSPSRLRQAWTGIWLALLPSPPLRRGGIFKSKASPLPRCGNPPWPLFERKVGSGHLDRASLNIETDGAVFRIRRCFHLRLGGPGSAFAPYQPDRPRGPGLGDRLAKPRYRCAADPDTAALPNPRFQTRFP